MERIEQMDSKALQMKTLLCLMDFLEAHPLLVKCFLRPVANAPFISGRMMVMMRAYMGATSFEIHDVDMEKGRISVGGVDEIMSGSQIIGFGHTVLAKKMGLKKKNETIYELGEKISRWEVTRALESGKWAPSFLVPLMVNGEILDKARTDPLTGRFFKKIMDTMSRIISSEGGWGRMEFDFSSIPIRVTLKNSQEAAQLAPSKEPVCHYMAGVVAGYASTISGEKLRAKEVSCEAMGDLACVFEVIRN